MCISKFIYLQTFLLHPVGDIFIKGLSFNFIWEGKFYASYTLLSYLCQMVDAWLMINNEVFWQHTIDSSHQLELIQ